MKSKLGSFFKELIWYEMKESMSLSPEHIALEFMNWKRYKTGEKDSYFRNKKRNGSRAWKYFTELSELLTNWQSKDIDVSLKFYFDQHSKYLFGGKNLYPHQLVLDRSYQYIFGKSSVDPTYLVYNEPLSYERNEKHLHDYAYCLRLTPEETLDEVEFPPDFVELYRKNNNLVKKDDS